MTDAAPIDRIVQLRAASEGVKDRAVITTCTSCREQFPSQNLTKKREKKKHIVVIPSDSLRGGLR